MIKLSKSCLGESEKSNVLKVLDNEYLGMGSEVQHFEKLLSDYFQSTAVCVVNGTCALQLALNACRISEGDEVIVPSLTYVASFQAISSTGAKPIPCDINEKDCNIDIAILEKLINSKTKAIMPVHYSGDPCNLLELYNIATKYNLRVIEDAAHAFGSTYQGKKIGSFGDIICFSFDGIKNITSGEGGCIVTKDKSIIEYVKDARLLGVEKDTENRFIGKRSWIFDVNKQGWRYHMSNIMAAIGISQFERFNDLSIQRKKIAKKYDLLLNGKSVIQIFNRNYDNIVPHIYVVLLPQDTNREFVQSVLLDKGIQTGIHYFPNHLLSLYKNNVVRQLPITDNIFPRLLTLPLHPDLKEEDIEKVTYNLLKIFNDNSNWKKIS
ncbi:MAG: DegT/DnrJ/EryC1/StrS family aminotransferase [Chitinophagaceae bacterium]|nr:DegT/DnrJ/EryC1/StrS family aminotransferase [Chitinophagaceae bacterium]